MATTYKATAAAVKVSVGPADGNRVARIIRRDGIIPDGVETEQLKRLEKLGLIEKVAEEADSTEVEAAAKTAAEADAKAAAEAKAKADAEAAAKKAAAAK
ncbi:hypothetical protein SEA_ELESAR_10 [Arthrobacter phage Elesar]|uniref:Uncharacterized protein n=1 Tax=Arthrobacter phage Elesar TaxID=2510522 RepID=A0A411CQE3_9CAUD|nr:hypothetical protein QEO79_gp10 [Arthrobacter phage Elesar]QAY16062.1 hypothetical protein SEA_ELESAR_10 [Arthrobacter phage Elesar]